MALRNKGEESVRKKGREVRTQTRTRQVESRTTTTYAFAVGAWAAAYPSNYQGAKLLDIILCGRDHLKVTRSENTVRLPRSNLHKVGQREITVVIERRGNATNVVSPRWT